LLKLLAGVETDHDGSTWRPNGLRIGMLEQEPTLDEGRSVMENVMDGVAEARDALRRCVLTARF
jgi:ATPase subunit of ABC transporter with duplicated ATPase domains